MQLSFTNQASIQINTSDGRLSSLYQKYGKLFYEVQLLSMIKITPAAKSDCRESIFLRVKKELDLRVHAGDCVIV